ncbi:pullulanase [Aliicoccus persicus]|uniref:pullulanase n=1 Tax=Aliicoccus persicus TaxID=930138 RepID=A0A662Z6E8_9STAP|nr:pullulanase [Aliicoccus persicus]SEW15549.1 pullulanase, extracellular [Aliicoccus persicus]
MTNKLSKESRLLFASLVSIFSVIILMITPNETMAQDDEIEDGFFRVHFETLLSDDIDDLGLWLWDDVAAPSEDWPTGALPFTDAVETDYGYYMDFELAENPQRIGLLINSLSGDGQTEDMEFDLVTPDMNEAWITSDWELFTNEPITEENTIRINYIREDGDYENWALWAWGDVAEPTEDWPVGAHDLDPSGNNGAYFDLEIAEDASVIQFLFVNKETEEQSEDLSFDDLTQSQIFLREGDDQVYTNPDFSSEVGVTRAELVSETEIEIEFHSTEDLDEESVLELIELHHADGEAYDLSDSTVTIDHDSNTVLLTGELDPESGAYTLVIDEQERLVQMGWRLKDSLYAYDGDLGLHFDDEGTPSLKVWSPSASQVNVILYDKDNQEEVVRDDIEMTQETPGVWEVVLDEETTGLSDVTGYFYHFEIEREGDTVLALDPYARSMAAWDNGNPDNYVGKAAIVNPSDIGPELDYATIDSFEKREDAIIYEVHVRDFTSDVDIDDELESQFGTFSAFIERLDYIEDLGVTHIQLLPVMSYFFADEFNNDERLNEYSSTNNNYNWGYDPHSYFSLTGMYSEDPEDPAKRIEEFKNLIDEIHSRDMGVILDVVYNHNASLHLFEDLEPNYYHFMDADGTPRTSFGGGRLGTTHEMSRRILVDSITYWVDEYKVDGFRFDMMGDHDSESIQKAYDEAAALNPNILMIGEGWVTYAGDAGDNVIPADQQWMDQTSAVGSFSDEIRNELKSGFGSEGQPMFLTGGPRSIETIYNNLVANPGNFNADEPGDVVPYIAAHDNLTLHDVIAQSIKKDPKDHAQEIHERIRIGNLMVLTAQGTPFIHAGQEYGRTKQFKHPDFIEPVDEADVPYKSTFMTDEDGEPFEYPYFIHDSYDSTDIINRFEWAKATDEEAYPINTQTRAYTKGLIELRRSTDAFSKGTMDEVDESVSLIDVPEIEDEDLAIVYCAESSDGDAFYVLVNTDEVEREFTLPVDLNGGDVIVDRETAGTEAIAEPVGVTLEADKVTLEPLTAVIVRVSDEVDNELVGDEDADVEVDDSVTEDDSSESTGVNSPVLNEDGTVTFYFEGDANTTSVGVPGSFNEWDESAFVMEEGEDSVWSYTAELEPGVYEYKLFVNNEWTNDPLNDVELENTNNELIVPGLRVEGATEVEAGTEVSFTTIYVDHEGEASEVNVEYSISEAFNGVELDENTLRVPDDAEAESIIELVVTSVGAETTHTVVVLDEMYHYTINYSRSDDSQMDWDMWIFGEGMEGDAHAFTEETEDGYAQAMVSLPLDEITMITRPGDWSQQEMDRVISIPEGETEVEVWINALDPRVYYENDSIEEIESRVVQLTYVREDQDYDGWNLWVWNTGAQDDEILFDEVTDEGAVANIEIGQNTTEIGFKIRQGDWEAEDDYNEDRMIEIDPNEQITKVTVYEGVGEFDQAPSINGPEIVNGNVTFFYRDPALYLADELDTIDSVELQLVGEGFEDTYEMTYDATNNYFVYTVVGVETGDYEYSFLVTQDGQPIEVEDPYAEGNFSYEQLDVSIETSVTPEAISYQEHAVVTIDASSSNDAEFSRGFIDLTEVGGLEAVEFDVELMAHTIAVAEGTSVGEKVLPVTLVDEFGNHHASEVSVEVIEREVSDGADFDWDEARIYFMLTDRFSDGDESNNDPHDVGYDTDHPESYHGGDFQGIINNLDYLDELGINTIWISPIVDNIDHDQRHGQDESQYGYHGYWAKDFTEIDEHFGDLETFKTLIDEAHDRDIKIMVDVVLNHTGYGLKPTDSGEDIPLFPTDEDRAVFEGMIREDVVLGSETMSELDGLPDLVTEDAAVRDQIIEWQTDWIERVRTDNGNTIDYFRVDTVKHVDNTTWNAFKNELTLLKPDFKLIGEWFGASVNNTADQLNTGRMDSLLDFNFKSQAQNFISGNIESVEANLAERNEQVDNAAMLGQFLSSHDEDGFLVTAAGDDEGLFKVAAALQITAKGQPVIYYGEEIGMSGVSAGNMDAGEFSENRYDFDWDRVDGSEMHEHYQKLLNIRADYSVVFSKGDRMFVAGSDDDGYSLFSRNWEDEQVLVGLNIGEDAVVSSFEVDFEAGTELMDLYNDVSYVVDDDQMVEIEIPGNVEGGTAVLVVQ